MHLELDPDSVSSPPSIVDDSKCRLNEFDNFKNKYKLSNKPQLLPNKSLLPTPSPNHNVKRFSRKFGNIYISQPNKNYNANNVQNNNSSGNIVKTRPLAASIKKYRIEKMTRLFVSKLKQSVIFSNPKTFDNNPLRTNTACSWFQLLLGDKEGLPENNFLIRTLHFLGLLCCIILLILYTIAGAFNFSKDQASIRIVQIISFLVFFGDMLLKFIAKTSSQGKIVNQISKIIPCYLTGDFKYDLIVMVMLFLNILNDNQVVRIFRIILVIKVPFCLGEIQNIKTMVCINNQREQQWGLLIVILTNFVFAHLISVSLVWMAGLDSNINWLRNRSLDSQVWPIQYAYAYYWATNIMLTVGFGDFCATNWREAIIITFIEMSGCIIFAYNINCVGNLMTNLRAQDLEKEKNIKIFNRMAMENGFSDKDTEGRIKQYIQKSFEIKKIFNIQNERETLGMLPKKLKVEYLKKANIKLIEKVQFLREFTKKTLEEIALNLQKNLSHPEEILMRRGEKCKLFILNKGEIAYISYLQKRGKNQSFVVEKVSSEGANQYKVICLKQFLKDEDYKYTVMATAYSMMYSIGKQEFEDSVRGVKKDLQKYCFFRDKDRFDESTGQLECSLCRVSEHSRFDCPHLHFVPIKQLVCFHSKKKGYNIQKKRFKIERRPRLQNLFPHFLSNYTKNFDECSSNSATQNNIDIVEECLLPKDPCSFNAQARAETLRKKWTLHKINSNGGTQYPQPGNSRGEPIASQNSILPYMTAALGINSTVNEEVDRLYQWKIYFPKFNMKYAAGSTAKKLTDYTS